MTLRRNVFAGYVAQAIVTLAGIVAVPTYLRLMGCESYALIGFFSLVQGWFQFLDAGLTPTVARETARFCAGVSSAGRLGSLLSIFQRVVVFTAIAAAIVVAMLSSAISRGWLRVDRLPLSEVQESIALMGAAVALRWIGGLYKGVISGFERLVLLSCVTIAAATARFLLVIPILMIYGANPVVFFRYQVIVALAEAVVLVVAARMLLRGGNVRAPSGAALPAKNVLLDALRFAATIGATTGLWILVTQTDKLVLSAVLPLSDYAYLTLAATAASGVSLISIPISSALTPHLSRLYGEKQHDRIERLYCDTTQLVCVMAVAAATVLCLFSQQILWTWTGNAAIARKASLALALYSAGNGLLALSSFPFYIQFARGRLGLHVVGSLGFLVVLVPAMIWGGSKFGVDGAGCAWLGANAIYFFCWVPYVHRRLLPGLHVTWVLRDVGRPAAWCIAFGLAAYLSTRGGTFDSAGRLRTGAIILACGSIVFVGGLLGSSAIRKWAITNIQWRKG